MGPFVFTEDQLCCSILNHCKGLIVHDGSPARRALELSSLEMTRA